MIFGASSSTEAEEYLNKTWFDLEKFEQFAKGSLKETEPSSNNEVYEIRSPCVASFLFYNDYIKRKQIMPSRK